MFRKCMWLMCGMGLCGLLAGQAVAADQEPLVYYPFDQLGALVVDASGKGHDGTPNGALVLGDGYVERGFQFNGNDTYVELARPIQDDFTLAAWIRTEAPGHEEGTSAFHDSGLFYADVGGSANDFVVAVLGTKLSSNVGNSNNSPPPDGIATYNFTVQGGAYKVSCRIIIPNGDSFWVRIPGASNLTPGEDPDNPGTGWVRWSDPPDSTSWYWYDVFSGDHDQETANWTLPAGTYTLEIARREDAALLDAIVISSVD